MNGLLKASYLNQEGKEHIMQFAMEDWWITDYQAYFNQTEATFTIDALEPTEVLTLSLITERNSVQICIKWSIFSKKSNNGYIALQRELCLCSIAMLKNATNNLFLNILHFYNDSPKH